MDGWHRLKIAEALERLETDPERGLSAADARRRLAERGPNELKAAKKYLMFLLSSNIGEIGLMAGASLVPVLELANWMERRGWPGRMD